jgi:hypothetical protein
MGTGTLAGLARVRALMASLQDYAGFVKLGTQVASINLELNDVRAAGSPPLEYYYQISLRMADEAQLSSARALSYFKTHNVGMPAQAGRG